MRISRDGLEQSRNACDEIRLFGLDKLCIGLRIEPRNKYARAAELKHRMDADAETEAMEYGHCRKHAFMTYLVMAHISGLQAECIEIHAAELYRLSDAGCTAGKKNYRGFIRRHMHDMLV